MINGKLSSRRFSLDVGSHVALQRLGGAAVVIPPGSNGGRDFLIMLLYTSG